MKYTGSKARISKEITKIFNEIIEENKIVNYIEPFVGGANVIENIVCENRYGFDNNEYVIALWNALLNGYNPPSFISRDEWYNVKNNFDSFSKEYIGLVGICASYNGCWFTSYGGFAIRRTNGHKEEYYRQAVNNIKNQLPKLKDVKFSVKNYLDLKIDKINNCLIYCDPPYQQGKNRYKEGNKFNHDEYWDWVRKISLNNFVICSEYFAPEDFIIIYEKQLAKTHPSQEKVSPTEKLFIYKDGKLKTQ